MFKNSRVDKVLTNVSINFIPEGFICDQVLTPLPVDKWSGIIAGYGNAHLRLVSSMVFDRGAYHTVPTVERNLTRTYVIDNHGLKDYVTERDLEEVEQPFNARSEVTMGLRLLLMIEKENTIATVMRNAANYGTNGSITLSGNGQFSMRDMSDPVKTFQDAKVSVFQRSKKRANTAIIPWDVLEVLRSHPKITNVYGQSGNLRQISVEQLKSALGLQNIIVPMSAYVNAADEETLFWGKDVIVYHRAPSAMKHQRTFGYKLTKRGHESRVYTRVPEDIPNSECILSDTAYQYLITDARAGYLIKNAIA